MNWIENHRNACMVALIILLEVIPHSHHRYDTVGDWRWNNNTLTISVSREAGLKNPDYVTLVFVHEAIEAILCRHDHVSGASVDRFDMNFKGAGEPGDDPKAPYHRQHEVAMKVEHEVAAALGVDWAAYEKALEAVPQK